MNASYPWLKHYPPGISTDLIPFDHSCLAALIASNTERFKNQTAFTQCMPNGMNASLTYGETWHLAGAFAAYLRESAGLKQGDRVAVQMPNCLAYPVSAFGVFRAGCVLVNTNPLYTSREMNHQFCDSGARALVIMDMFTEKLNEALEDSNIEKIITVRITDLFPILSAAFIRLVLKYVKRQIPSATVDHTPFHKAVSEGENLIRHDRADFTGYIKGQDNDTAAMIQYTGGTTGVAKGAVLSHGNLLSNAAQGMQFMANRLETGREVLMTALPLYHIFAFTVSLFIFHTNGTHNILIPSPRPLDNLKKGFEKFDITWMAGVNTLYNGLLSAEWFKANPPRHIKASVAGGMALHDSVAEKWEESVGSSVVEGYGLTEASPVLTFNPFGAKVKRGSIGIPLPGTDIRCFDKNFKEVPQGEAGELCAKGPQVMKGYWNRPEETEKVLKEGWLLTGDIAVMDEDGFFRIIDRKKDMILVSGFNVFPNEVEACIAQYPGVEEVAVIGIPSDKTGEQVMAFIVRNREDLTEDELRQHCKKLLTNYKVPRILEFREALPKSSVGKILRKELRDQELAKFNLK